MAFVHSTEHVAHGAVSATSRGWPLSCANAGHADIRASSSLSPCEAVLPALWACGLAPMHRHTLHPFALIADSFTLMRHSLHDEPFLPYISPLAYYRTAYSEKSKRGRGSVLHRGGGWSSDRKEEKFPLYPFLIAA